MSTFLESSRNIFKIHELRQRVIYTALLLIVVRLGAHITLPGVDAQLIAEAQRQFSQNSLFGIYDLFVGGAFRNAAIFSLGVMPYISASIVIQMLGAVFPFFQKLSKEGEEGRKKINQYTRYGTVVISMLQGAATAANLTNMSQNGMPIVPIGGVGFIVSAMIFMTAGTIFMMWIGEQITERGIGNGISLIIFIGIIARFPVAVMHEITLFSSQSHTLIEEFIIFVLLVFVVAGVVMVTQGTRRIPVQYAKRVVGRKVYGGVTQYIPMRVNTAGVMPIIFAQAIMFLPSFLFSFFPDSEWVAGVSVYFQYTSITYSVIYGIMIVGFTFFYTAIAFNPKDVADNMQKQGGFIPGIRPGKHTSDFIDNILTKITLPGSIFLAIIAILPAFATRFGVSGEMSQFFGGTSLLIVVGVALDTLQQMESHLLMRHYDGFMKSGKIKGRIGR